MALKTNSKQARENLKKWIIDNFNFEEYLNNTGKELEKDFSKVSSAIIDTFNSEKYYSNSYAIAHGIAPSKMFYDWMSGLPTMLSSDDIFLKSAIDTLGDILEQTPQEKAKYKESDAEVTMCNLIYRELTR